MKLNWPYVQLKSVLKPIWREEATNSGQVYSLLGAHWYGLGLYIKSIKRGYEIRAKKLFLVRAGDFVYNRLFAWKGSFALAGKEVDSCYVSNEFPCFVIEANRLDGEFLWWFFRRENMWTESLSLSAGATSTSRNRLKESLFLKMQIPLPLLAEQKSIVGKIRQLNVHINNAMALRRQAIKEVERLLASATEQCFKPQPGWKIMTVADFCEPPQYGYTASATNQPIGPHLLRITDIQRGQVNWGKVPFCNCPDPAKYLLKPGDLVFARTGPTGKSFLIRSCPEAVFASYLIRLRVRNTVSIEYLYRYFQSPSYWAQIADEKKGTAQLNLNASKLKKLLVPVPPSWEQKRIVTEMDELLTKVDSLKRLQAETAGEIDDLLSSFLDRAFTGNV